MKTNRITWIASWPKSGNTWVRLWLEAYLTGRPIDFRRPMQCTLGDTEIRWYQAATTTPVTELEPFQACMLRSAALMNALNEYGSDVTMKTHQARVQAFGTMTIPGWLSRRAIYIVRDPRDIAVSWARHCGITFDESISCLLGETVLQRQGGKVPQYIGGWAKHVKSWVDNLPEEQAGPDFQRIVVRYEDLLGTDDCWYDILRALDLPRDQLAITTAVNRSSFHLMQEQEALHGFSEAGSTGAAFFQEGKSGYWEQLLSDEQVSRIEEGCGDMMQAMGYDLTPRPETRSPLPSPACSATSPAE